MSRIGRRPIEVPNGVTVEVSPGGTVNVQGPLGALEQQVPARIQIAQEAHAAMCEKLGIARCRITGMRYGLVNEQDVSASLELKLDPAIARQFGKAEFLVGRELPGQFQLDRLGDCLPLVVALGDRVENLLLDLRQLVRRDTLLLGGRDGHLGGNSTRHEHHLRLPR